MINKGKFIGDTYQKNVDFSKAVLWKTREISIPPDICRQMLINGTKEVWFTDRKKGQKWVAEVSMLRGKSVLKKEGQEPQRYFPIELFKKIDLNPPKPDSFNKKEEVKQGALL
jgi:hypothetical protein